MRIGVLAALALASASAPAAAGPGWIEVSGFFGVDALPADIKLGSSTEPEQRPQTAPIAGGRLTWVALPLDHFELAVEAEVGFTASWTGYGFATQRDSYFAPVISYRGSLVLRLAELAQCKPHVLVGGGGASVVTSSPFMRDTTDPQLFYGLGATIEIGHALQLRIDAKQGFIATTDGGHGATYELVAGIGGAFGRPIREPEPETSVPPPPPVVVAAPVPVTVPEPTPVVVTPPPPPPPDPNLDTDGDGIPDLKDKCPTDPETKNGYEDEDGCPDTVPPEIATALAAAAAIRFEPKRARLRDEAKTELDVPLAVLRSHPRMHVNVVVHASPSDTGSDIAKKRGEVVKWYLVEQGVPADLLDIVVGDPIKPKGPPIELVVAPRP